MTGRRTLHLTTLVAAAALLAFALALSTASHEAGAAFPGENGRMAFSAEGAGGGSRQIYTVGPDGTGEKQLTAINTAFNVEPSFSADGRKIAWNRNGDVWVMNPNGTAKRRLTSGPARDSGPAFSPDGRRVAWSRNGDVYLKALDGGSPRRVTNDRVTTGNPAFSPDGRRIAFPRHNSDCTVPDSCGYDDLATVRPDGTGLRVINVPGRVYAEDPDWSPDGDRLVFAVLDIETERTRVETIGADGSGHQTVFAPNSLDVYDPVFSPDGTKIAFTYASGQDIWTINPDGMGLTKVTNTPTGERFEMHADWRPRPAAAD